MSDANWLSPENLDPAKLAIELAKAVSKSEAIKNYAKRTLDAILNGETQIAVLGAGGTGKSTFAHVITSDNPLHFDSTYESDIEQKNVQFPGKVSARLLVAPGQARYVSEVWPRIFDTLEKKKSLAIINLVAFGYHSFDLSSFEEFELFTPGMSEEKFLEAYLEQRRGIELERLHALKDGISEVKRNVWMMTVVGKQDLWWSSREKVIKHYTDADGSEYAQLLAEIENDLGARGLAFSHHFVPVSHVVSNFLGPDGQILAPTSAGYDLDEHIKHLYNLTRRFNDLLEGKKL
ncbi:hypothetical protein [Aliiroseovarius sp. PrR006]|uniref:hypothetical protein n=1 Tax=Aliiroseovarius sp. PrR006 TaxID=2706883 RepID=UPI0013D88BB2|nr:hypothetical protein [Aliiroseovarius sp. PrR006]NDW53145.1 hypothetical protein [Aliiroseovarius sp. PrR006]